jgi:hypothetical protein
VPRLLVGVAEDDELELGGRLGVPAPLRQPVELAAQDLAGRGDDLRPIAPHEVREAQDGARMPWDRAQRAEVGLELEVAVAALPRGHGVARDRVHLDVHGEEVVAPLRAVVDDLVEEVAGHEALALQPALHVGHAEQDGVDRAVLDGLGQLLERHDPASSFSDASMAANSSSGAEATRWCRE